jgi:hypothetical protein
MEKTITSSIRASAVPATRVEIPDLNCALGLTRSEVGTVHTMDFVKVVAVTRITLRVPMSLFIARQAFAVEADFEAAKIAVFAAQVLSAAISVTLAFDCGPGGLVARRFDLALSFGARRT